MAMDPETSEMVIYWRGVIATLYERNLLTKLPRQGGVMLPQADGYLFTDRAVFNLDMHRLAGIPREAWLDPDLWAQWQDTLQGRRCFTSYGGGLGICIARQPGQHTKHLPTVIPLTAEHLPEKPYHVTLGHSRRGPVLLDLAEKNRAILIGGWSGSGKTNAMQSIILQLVKKHTPSELQIAIVDTKQVDFGAKFARLPHLFAPVAHDLDEAARLIESVENERLRRQAVMADAGVSHWRKADDLGLLLLVVDEAADFARTTTMDTQVEIARKGRAFGISVIVATQHPTTKVIDTQVKANLPTAIAFQTRTGDESRVILGRGGAQTLNRPGLALSFLDGRWQKIQTLWIDVDNLPDLGGVAAPERPALSSVETALVHHAVEDEELHGRFIVNQLYEAFKGQISKRRLETLAQQWEDRGWLTAPMHATDPRRVTPELLALVYPAQDAKNGDRVTGVTGDDRDAQTVTGTAIESPER